MKSSWLIGLALAAVGIGVVYFIARRGGIALGTGETGQGNIVLGNVATDSTPDNVLDLGGGNATSDKNQLVNDALAQDKIIESGIGVPVINQYPITFMREEINPLTGKPQRFFRLNEPSQLRIQNPVAFAFSTEPFQGNFQFRTPNTFVEILPTGSGSTSLNVVESGVSGHPGSTTVSAPLKPGDPGYEAALAAARQKIEQGRTKTITQGITIVGSPPSSSKSTGFLTSPENRAIVNKLRGTTSGSLIGL